MRHVAISASSVAVSARITIGHRPRPEAARDEPVGSDREPRPPSGRNERVRRDPLERVGPGPVAALLDPHRVHGEPHRRPPVVVERCRIAGRGHRGRPQAHRGAQGIELPLAFMEPGPPVREVVRPAGGLVAVGERVRVRVEEDAACLPRQDPASIARAPRPRPRAARTARPAPTESRSHIASMSPVITNVSRASVERPRTHRGVQGRGNAPRKRRRSAGSAMSAPTVPRARRPRPRTGGARRGAGRPSAARAGIETPAAPAHRNRSAEGGIRALPVIVAVAGRQLRRRAPGPAAARWSCPRRAPRPTRSRRRRPPRSPSSRGPRCPAGRAGRRAARTRPRPARCPRCPSATAARSESLTMIPDGDAQVRRDRGHGSRARSRSESTGSSVTVSSSPTLDASTPAFAHT